MTQPHTSRSGRVVHGEIQTARGYLGDADYVAVEAMLMEAVETAKDVEAERDRYRLALEQIEAQGPTYGAGWKHWRLIAREALNV